MHDETYPDIGWLLPRHLTWLRANGVLMSAIVEPQPVRLAHGFRAADGRFDPDPSGPDWFAFVEAEDVIFWRPKNGEVATWDGRAFALGEAAIDNPATYSFGQVLNIYSDPLMWLRARRDGCVVLNWRFAFDKLRHCPRVAIAESLVPIYDRHMQPPRMPEVFVLRRRKEAAA
ncbi:hypothetical protein [Rhizobium leguminosarum]|uniref:hypothetical protein n=1 Tax=Rhizobium leguminosarum TaxID=384 RepID=UPI0004B306D0|nr:hypothetical protein [Rhizobium leguminosarum]WFT88030.1 hypothetical protein QA638_10755 [Rhizobium leguminosarum]